MQKKRMTWAVLSAGALVFTAACDQMKDPTGVATASALKVPSWVSAVVAPQPGKNEVWACKEGPQLDNPYTFTVTGSAFVQFPAGSPFTLEREQCKLVAEATKKKQQAVVTETSIPPHACFDHADIYLYIGGVFQNITTVTTRDVHIDLFGPDRTFSIVFVDIANANYPGPCL